MKLAWLIIVFVCGALLPIQAGLNTRLGKSIGSPVYASLFSFLVGAAAVAIYLLFTKETVTWAGAKSAGLSSWLGGGLTGAIFITATMMAVPRIGMALTFSLVVAGQMIVAVALDHFKVLVAEQHSFNIWRLAGIVIIICGVILVRKF
ncbi:MAG TPA: DMT family transporter [Chitinophagaceae bacterium]|nr:DMT family transporter [Chitinophagaceae bacterium]